MTAITSSVRLLSRPFRRAATGSTISSYRQFSIKAKSAAKKTPRQAPSIRREERAQNRENRQPSNPSRTGSPTNDPASPGLPDELVWPLKKLFTYGYSSGVLTISPDEAIGFLRGYLNLQRTKPLNWEQNICEEHNLSPETVFRLAFIINRGSNNRNEKQIATSLSHTASNLGHAPATIELVSLGLNSGNLKRDDYHGPLKKLNLHARNGNARANLLLGRIRLDEGREGEALTFFKSVTQSPAAPAPGLMEVVRNIGTVKNASAYAEAKTEMGKIYLKRGNKDAAFHSFTIAAGEDTYPRAFYELGMLTEDDSQREELMIRAAEGGIAEAAHEAGVSMLRLWEDAGSNGSVKVDLERQKWAKEWLFLGADWGQVESAKVLEELLVLDGEESEVKK